MKTEGEKELSVEEICKYGVAETELVLICDWDNSGDHNCHWHWDAGDLAKSLTG